MITDPLTILFLMILVIIVIFLPTVFLLLSRQHAMSIAWFSLAMTVFGGGWVWFAIFVLAAWRGISKARAQAWLNSLTAEERWHHLMECER